MIDAEIDTGDLILSSPSPSLDDMCGDNKIAYDDVVRESILEASILLRDTPCSSFSTAVQVLLS